MVTELIYVDDIVVLGKIKGSFQQNVNKPIKKLTELNFGRNTQNI